MTTTAPAITEEVFDGPTPQETAYVKWDVDNGRDRPMDVQLDTNFTLDGSPQVYDPLVKPQLLTVS
ncbi:hypothetical protein MY10362_001230 [Beauveria mimosiformis]